ncbi:MAG: hypothetical protein EXR92_05395 [Gemmatimonadetes bacterium]|nr:hypothetical protein [Gemmatimonadota bacterium]
MNGILIVGVVQAFDPPNVVLLIGLAALLALQLILDGIRLAVPRANVLFFRIFAPFVTPREEGGIASSTWYVLGALLAFALFPRTAAIGGIVVLALADPTANLVGRLWGRIPFGVDGTLEGTTAFFVMGVASLLVLVDPVAAAVAAAAATTAERLPLPLDDNLTIPLATGAALWLMGIG